MDTQHNHQHPQPAAAGPAIRCADLQISRGGSPILNGLDLTVMPGRVHALLGRNGAGKSTTFRIILGLLAADTGTAEVLGQPISPRRGREILARTNGLDTPEPGAVVGVRVRGPVLTYSAG